MSRIISGVAGSIRLAGAAPGTRPTSDRVKESLFGALEADGAIENARVLDLFAGTLALGLEALSRGAESLVAIEKHRPALEVCLRNAASVGTALNASGRRPPMEIKLTDAFSYLAGTPKEFDLVFADPPYDLAPEKVAQLLSLIGHVISDDGVVVLEQAGSVVSLDIPNSLELWSRREYGDTSVWMLRATAR